LSGRVGLRGVYAILTAHCNLACAYCYQNEKKLRRMGWHTCRRPWDWPLSLSETRSSLSSMEENPYWSFPTSDELWPTWKTGRVAPDGSLPRRQQRNPARRGEDRLPRSLGESCSNSASMGFVRLRTSVERARPLLSNACWTTPGQPRSLVRREPGCEHHVVLAAASHTWPIPSSTCVPRAFGASV